jgi:serine protease
MFAMKVINLFILFILFPLVGFTQHQSEFLPNTIILKVKEAYRINCKTTAIDYPEFTQLASNIGITEVKKIFPNHKKETNERFVDLSLIYQITYSKTINELELAKKISRLSFVQYAEPYVLPEAFYTPNDPIITTDTAKIWHLIKINAFGAWDITKGDTNVVVGITDTGWDSTHPDLLGNVKINYNDPINGLDDDGDGYTDNYMGWDLGNNDNDAQQETSSHGTHVSGLSSAVTDNGVGIAAVGFNTKFMPLKIANSAGVLTQAYQGVVYAADHGCFIINCSWGSTTPGQFQKDVIDYAIINKGCLVVGACGNNNNETLFYPAAYDGVLTVAASEQSDLKKNNSNYGYYVDISAPGESMWSTIGGGSYGYNGGTSMAAPVVSGAAALVKSIYPSYTNHQIAALLRATADDIDPLNPTFTDKLGNGRLNIFSALAATSTQFVELINKQIFDNNDNVFVDGDTIRMEGTFANYLDTISGLTATLSSLSPYVTVVDATTNLPTLNTNQTFINTADPFLVQVLNGAPLNEQVLFKMVISNGSFSVNEYFYVTLNPDYINMEVNQIRTTITSKGKIGFNDVNNTVGLGFSFNGKQLLYESGLMLGENTNQVSDCVRGASGQDLDFASVVNVKYHPPYVSAIDLIGEFNDATYALSLNLNIEQQSFAYASAPNDKFVIVQYRLRNDGLTTLNNLYAGLFADWDIQNYALNESGIDAIRKMGFVRSLESDSTYAAIKLLTNGTFVNYSLDNVSGGAGGVDISDVYTTAEKYTTLSSNKTSAGSPSGQDVAHVVSSGGFTLAAGDSVTVAFALIAGVGLTDIQASADAAQTAYENIIGVEELDENKVFTIYPNPTQGKISIKTNEQFKQIAVKNVLGEHLLLTKSESIDLSALPNGIYFIELQTKENTYLKKIVVSR